jgi:hypothetical protein
MNGSEMTAKHQARRTAVTAVSVLRSPGELPGDEMKVFEGVGVAAVREDRSPRQTRRPRSNGPKAGSSEPIPAFANDRKIEAEIESFPRDIAWLCALSPAGLRIKPAAPTKAAIQTEQSLENA